MRLILLAGDIRVGKTTFGKKLAAHLGLPHTAFADEVKSLAANYYPEKSAAIYAETKTATTRELLCKVSLIARETIHDDLFTQMALQKATFKGLVISDLRFNRELEYINKLKLDYELLWIGGPTDTYDLKSIYKYSTKYLPKYPELNDYLS